MHEQLALGRHLVADEQVEVAEPGREQQTHERVADRDAGRCRSSASPCPVSLAGVALAGRDVELGLARAGDDVVARPLAEVDPGLGDLRRAVARHRRQVADEQPRLALVRDLVDRHHRGADAVGVDDPLVHEADAQPGSAPGRARAPTASPGAGRPRCRSGRCRRRRSRSSAGRAGAGRAWRPAVGSPTAGRSGTCRPPPRSRRRRAAPRPGTTGDPMRPARRPPGSSRCCSRCSAPPGRTGSAGRSAAGSPRDTAAR